MLSKRDFRLAIGIALVFAALFLFPTDYSLSFTENNNPRGLDLYFVRHAETLANATGVYTEGNERTITEKGMRQIERLTEALQGYEFDAVIVSPKIRAMKTIEPYLQKSNMTAVIWPEMAESEHFFTKKKDVSDERFVRGKEIVLDAKSARYFKFRSEKDRFEYKDGGFDSAVARLRKGCDLIDECFGQSGKTILVVGHSGSGAVMIDILLGRVPAGKYF
ncbi:MAG: histidine phosphatase family protein, partial [Candidatus Omnitrophica bacterium]|nr:histidine phosphatase family protein [Candidatus Omnitrophota bacterium]